MLNKIVFENLRQRPVRTLLSVMAIGVEVTMILTLVGVSYGTLDETARRARGVGADIIVRPPASSIISLSSSPMPEAMLPFFMKQPHVKLATGTVILDATTNASALGYHVVSAEGFVAALEACEAPNVIFDLAILGHSIPTKDKEQIISHFRQHCDAPVLALLRPHEGAMQSTDRSIEQEPEKLIAAVREILST